MTKDPDTLIEQYLERVRVYLPLDSEDIVTEIRTHILMSAEEIGEGRITTGSTLMAIERLGEPKGVANEYAGTGKRVGPVPAEYAQPLFRILFAFFAISAAFIVGAYMIGMAFGDLWGLHNLPFAIPLIIVLNLIIIFLFIGVISLFVDRSKLPTERTTLEGVFGIGSGAFKPKSKLEAAADVVLGIIVAIILFLPPIVASFNPAIVVFMKIAAMLLLVGSLRGLSVYLFGENNLNLLIETLTATGWIILSSFLVNFLYPIYYFYSFNGTEWVTTSIAELASLVPSFDLTIVFTIGWSVFLFILVAGNIWAMLVSSMKMVMYYQQGKGIWWTGTWGTRKYHRLRRRWWDREPKLPQSEERTYEDGYQNQD